MIHTLLVNVLLCASFLVRGANILANNLDTSVTNQAENLYSSDYLNDVYFSGLRRVTKVILVIVIYRALNLKQNHCRMQFQWNANRKLNLNL